MRREHAGGSALAGPTVDDLLAQRGRHLLHGHAAGSQEGGRRTGHEFDDGRLHPDLARPTVEHGVDAAIQIGEHVIGRRRAHVPEPVGRRGRHPTAAAGQAESTEQVEGQRVVGHPHPDRRTATGHRIDRTVGGGHDQGERTRPTRLGETASAAVDQPFGVGPVGELVGRADVHDQRVPGRPPLGGEDPGDRLGRGGVTGQPVDGLGRDRHQAAGQEDLDGPAEVARAEPLGRAHAPAVPPATTRSPR